MGFLKSIIKVLVESYTSVESDTGIELSASQDGLNIMAGILSGMRAYVGSRAPLYEMASQYLRKQIELDARGKLQYMRKTGITKRLVLHVALPIVVPLALSYRRGILAKLVAVTSGPLVACGSYLTLPREPLQVIYLRDEAINAMATDEEACELVELVKAKPTVGAAPDFALGSLLPHVGTIAEGKRHKYAAKIAQIARCKVGFMRNTPENKLIYQRVLIEIMDKDCIRYCHRDLILGFAVGYCFVYPKSLKYAPYLWKHTDTEGLK